MMMMLMSRNEARAGQWDDVECNKNLTFVCRFYQSCIEVEVVSKHPASTGTACTLDIKGPC